MKSCIYSLVLAFVLSSADAQDWAGFHGLTCQGVGLTPSPALDWSAGMRTVWTTDIPGLGFSSPIVAGDKIYLTTAYQTEKGHGLKLAILYGNACLLFGLLTMLGAAQVRSLTLSRSVIGDLLGSGRALILVGSATITLGVVLFGNHLFGLEGFVHRSWKLGTITGTVYACMSVLLAGRKPRRLLVVSVISILMSLCSYWLMPRRELFMHFTTSDEVISTALVFMPALACFGTLIVSLIFSRRQDSGVGTRKVSSIMFSGRLLLCWGLPVLVAAVLFWILGCRVGRASTYEQSVVAVVPWAFIAIMAALCVGALATVAFLGFKRSWALKWPEDPALVLSSVAGLSCLLQFSWFSAQKQLAYSFVCVDKDTGQKRWAREIAYGSHPRDMKERNSQATPTPVASGERLSSYFGNAGLYGLDLQGSLAWKVEDMPFETWYGVGHSPTFGDGIVVLVNDCEAPSAGKPCPSQIAAFALENGRFLWKRERPRAECGRAGYCTPIIRNIGGKNTVVVRGWEDLTGYDLRDGAIRWSRAMKYHADHLVASLVTDEKRIYLMDAENVTALNLNDLQAKSELIAWRAPVIGEKISTPILVNRHLFGVTETGQAFCLDAENGIVKWKHRLRGRFFASLVALGNTLLFTSEAGHLTLVDATGNFKIIAEHQLHQEVRATPVPLPSPAGFLVRGANHLSLVVPQVTGNRGAEG